ncbi:MAG TPA: hypothetical protein VJA21_13995 [Verrucomicrobiae bacterium]
MKVLTVTLSLAAGLSLNALAARHVSFGFHGHHGGYWCGDAFVPGLALGIGLGALATYPWGGRDYYYYPAYGYGYYYPSYAYAYPPPANAAPSTPAANPTPANEAPQPAPAPETPPWVPSSPGSGTWVPDPEPYSFTPGQPATPKSSAAAKVDQTTSLTTSPGGVPVYSNVQNPAR